MADPVINQNNQQPVILELGLIQTITSLILANTDSKIKTAIKLDGELASLSNFIFASLKLFKNVHGIEESDEIPADIIMSTLLQIEKAVLKQKPKELNEIKEIVLMALITSSISHHDGYDLRDWTIWPEEERNSLIAKQEELRNFSEFDDQQDFFSMLADLNEAGDLLCEELQNDSDNIIKEQLGISKNELNRLIDYRKIDREIQYKLNLRINNHPLSEDLTNELKDLLQTQKLFELQRKFLRTTNFAIGINENKAKAFFHRYNINTKTLPESVKNYLTGSTQLVEEENQQNNFSVPKLSFTPTNRFFVTPSTKVDPVDQPIASEKNDSISAFRATLAR